ncbi:uncharacterized protein N7515_008639 [Penicillium bovifimosum]|uniref:Uncharacterized protein n=1 Tax=Penicillium bovifimosum TaxID=126998 RepID=A0A9W9GNT5_9EURO|nr:uncharacterized protein N7515_008639 [Penicillium bovifimosum]KAJ5124814.1 hypothetical protein N7515_008639 [Penicillium bovifimosum]
MEQASENLDEKYLQMPDKRHQDLVNSLDELFQYVPNGEEAHDLPEYGPHHGLSMSFADF